MKASHDRTDVSLFARAWVIASPVLERIGLARSRRRLVSGLSGTVVEVGAGSGVTFEHYPPQVTRVVAIEPDPHLRAHARRYAARASVPVEVVESVAEALPLADGEADAVVFGLVLCTVPDVPAALAEADRVLAPGGELRLFEHVRAEGRLGRVADRIAPVWSRLGGGCRPNRDTGRALTEAGFDVTGLRTRTFPPVLQLTPILSGSARRR
ncbi:MULTISPECIES: class I SAM-dependent methyltransferase [unclassified Dietzia]|uniref:class I SAM-dependent methyltransferase n=1 Tax=unclassified Dietzia TaxID=2617939 RepID=UPI0015FDD0D2|nr:MULTISPECIES: class I SAM-dependent methyltransferase [unclassified Dietzia]MBB1025021.1 class I SAM-dependent methyltransferase [Dietzia sp. DQ12-76]MBB1026660.1 class I SAM-dependent methyltransferase [Dietzia sp. DQ11-38-2]